MKPKRRKTAFPLNQEKKMRIGVLCSGGDAPGMNPCLRAIVRAGVKYGDEIVGICHGYRGLLEEEVLRAYETEAARIAAEEEAEALEDGVSDPV